MSVQDAITGIKNDTAKVNAEKNKDKVGSDNLDQDAFLQLLMVQLQSQDPTNPMDSSQFMQQQAQFTQISELQKLNKNFSNTNGLMQASSMIGKDVTITDPDDNTKTISGTVTEATMDSSGANIVIGKKAYPVSLVKSIKDQQS